MILGSRDVNPDRLASRAKDVCADFGESLGHDDPAHQAIIVGALAVVALQQMREQFGFWPAFLFTMRALLPRRRTGPDQW